LASSRTQYRDPSGPKESSHFLYWAMTASRFLNSSADTGIFWRKLHDRAITRATIIFFICPPCLKLRPIDDASSLPLQQRNGDEIDCSRQGIVFDLLVTNWESLLREKKPNCVQARFSAHMRDHASYIIGPAGHSVKGSRPSSDRAHSVPSDRR